jgi:glutathione S-transferase
MKLYEFPPTRSIRVRWALQELELPFEAVSVKLTTGEHQQAAYKKVNPAGKLPALVDGDTTLTESGAILLYLGEKYPERGLIPKQLAERAQHNRWLLFTITELEQPLWRIARNTAVYPAAERVPADIPRARKDFLDMAAVIEAHMRGRQFVVGDSFSMCDIALAYTLDWANESQLLADCPALSAYMERMYTRPRAGLRIAKAFAQLREG